MRSAATIAKKVRPLKRVFQLAEDRGQINRYPLHRLKELAGHAGIETTERFYLAVRKDLVDRARAASEASRKGQSVARLLRTPCESEERKELQCISVLQAEF